MINKIYNSHDYPFYITDLDINHGVTRTRMNLVKKIIPLSEMEEGDYVYTKGINGSKNGSWNMVLEQKGTFPDIAKQFIKHAEAESIPKLAVFPYFAYDHLDLSKKALYLVVKKADMIDIISNKAKHVLEAHVKLSTDVRAYKRSTGRYRPY